MLATVRQAPANLLAVEVRSNQRQNENGYHSDGCRRDRAGVES